MLCMTCEFAAGVYLAAFMCLTNRRWLEANLFDRLVNAFLDGKAVTACVPFSNEIQDERTDEGCRSFVRK